MDPLTVREITHVKASPAVFVFRKPYEELTIEQRWELYNEEGLKREAAPVPILWERVHPTALIPTHGQEGDAAVDLFTPEAVTVPAHGKVLIPIGFKPAIPAGYAGFIWPRSGLSLKASLETGAGLIDRSYRKELGVILYNNSDVDHHFEKDKAVAQLVVAPYVRQASHEVDELPPSDRSEGWGSSGR